ncbi:MAG: hypothetical protein EXQ96_05560 [Alphaproteobacteria bacterium]|nr:hypothetical protein [Alphaproteobacteria bacterium]
MAWKTLLAGALGAAAMIGMAGAVVVTESGDAGNTPATAQVLPGATTEITGEIGDGQDTDLYKFTLIADGTVTTNMHSPVRDVNLIVFNGLGQGLAGDDDDDSSCTPIDALAGFDSCLTLELTAGVYYFAA